MQSSWPENMIDDRKRAIRELIRGRNLTNRLRDMLKNINYSYGDGTSKVAEDLVAQIFGTFSKSICILNSIDSGEVSQGGGGAGDPSSPCFDGRRSEDSSGSCKTSLKDGRGCYKRRKTSEAQIKDSPTLVDDGQAWRKYGQKVILNANYPRNYFRCTHRFDQNCKATKQVQRIQEQPPLYRTTYLGKHTCRNFQKCPQVILHPTQPDDDSSVLLCFDHNNPTTNDYPFIPTLSSLIKDENKEDHESLYHSRSHIGSSCSDGFLPSDDHLDSPFETTRHVAALSSSSDYADVISSGVTMDVNQLIGIVDFDDFLREPLVF